VRSLRLAWPSRSLGSPLRPPVCPRKLAVHLLAHCCSLFTFQTMNKPRKMPAPWELEEIPVGYRVDNAEGKSVAYFYGLDPR